MCIIIVQVQYLMYLALYYGIYCNWYVQYKSKTIHHCTNTVSIYVILYYGTYCHWYLQNPLADKV